MQFIYNVFFFTIYFFYYSEFSFSLAPISKYADNRENASIYFSWQTYGTLIKKGNIYPQNTDLALEFQKNPSKYPLIKEVFDEANSVFENINFYDYIIGNLQQKDPTMVRITNILFSYAITKSWIQNFSPQITAITFTSGGMFPSLLLSESISIKDGIILMKDIFDYIFPKGIEIQKERNTYSALLKGETNEDILSLINWIILLNPELKLSIKEYRANNIVIISGERESIEIISNLFIDGDESIYFGKYNLPIDMFGNVIQKDPRHKVEQIYADLPVHTPMLKMPDKIINTIKNLKFTYPKYPVVGMNFKNFTSYASSAIQQFIDDSIFGFINTAMSFENIAQKSNRIIVIGPPEWFINDVRNAIKFNISYLIDPNHNYTYKNNEIFNILNKSA